MESLEIRISTYGGSYSLPQKLDLKKERERQFYVIRSYDCYAWQVGKEVPLFVYGSSWQDGNNVERMCGVAKLEEGSEETDELLNSSPHYYLVSYLVE